jgi:hypothetical protein
LPRLVVIQNDRTPLQNEIDSSWLVLASVCDVRVRRGGADRLPDLIAFVAAEVVEHDDVAWPQDRNHELADMSEEALAVVRLGRRPACAKGAEGPLLHAGLSSEF